MKWHYLPNIVTAFRFLMVGPFLYLMFDHQYALAFFIFILASISDALDGFLARRFKWQSKWGAFADPLADKLLIMSSYVALTWNHHLPLWFTILMVLRDLVIVTGAIVWHRYYSKVPLKPTTISKINTIFQLVLIVVILYQCAFFYLPLYLIHLLTLLTAATTLFSFMDYILRWSLQVIQYSKKNS